MKNVILGFALTFLLLNMSHAIEFKNDSEALQIYNEIISTFDGYKGDGVYSNIYFRGKRVGCFINISIKTVQDFSSGTLQKDRNQVCLSIIKGGYGLDPVRTYEGCGLEKKSDGLFEATTSDGHVHTRLTFKKYNDVMILKFEDKGISDEDRSESQEVILERI